MLICCHAEKLVKCSCYANSDKVEFSSHDMRDLLLARKTHIKPIQ
jgi:hypothetical protein